MKILIVGGVAGGATAAARIRNRWGYRGTRTAFRTDARSVREAV